MNHQIDHRDQNSSLAAFGTVFVILAQPPVMAQPAERALDYPAMRHNRKAFGRLFDNLDDPREGQQRPLDKLSGIATVRPNQLQSRISVAHPFERQPPAVAVLNVSGMHHRRQDQSQGVDHDVALAPGDLFARVVAAARAPFSTLLTLWLSMIAALGVGPLPAWIRTFSRRVS